MQPTIDGGMKKVSFADMHCSLARTLDIMGDWWTPLIVRDVHLGITRFAELAEDLGISRNLLTQRLAHLLDKGILHKTAYQERPARYDYHLTEKGKELVPPILALMAWGDRWAAPEAGPPLRIRHRTCGKRLEPVVVCSSCGEPVLAEDIVALPGPGGATAPGTMLIGKFLSEVR